MHKSSFDKMEKFVDDYLDVNSRLSILDVGSQDLNGSFRVLFMRKHWKYIGADIVQGKNVDVLLKDPFDWSKDLKSDTFDVVISGQAFEHIERPWKAIQEVQRVLKPGALCCIITPSNGEYHGEFDYWRFYSDGLKALAKYANLYVVYSMTDNVGQWRDTILIARKLDEENEAKLGKRIPKD